jgi:hypothetical protein
VCLFTFPVPFSSSFFQCIFTLQAGTFSHSFLGPTSRAIKADYARLVFSITNTA